MRRVLVLVIGAAVLATSTPAEAITPWQGEKKEEHRVWWATPDKRWYSDGWTVKENGHIFEKICQDTGWRRARRGSDGFWKDFEKEIDCLLVEYDENGRQVRQWKSGKRWVPVRWDGRREEDRQRCIYGRGAAPRTRMNGC